MDDSLDPSRNKRGFTKGSLERIVDDGVIDYGTYRVCEYPECGTVLHHYNGSTEKYCYVCTLKIIIEEDSAYADKLREEYRRAKKKQREKENVQSKDKTKKSKRGTTVDDNS